MQEEGKKIEETKRVRVKVRDIETEREKNGESEKREHRKTGRKGA
jgi:hypothetical protein